MTHRIKIWSLILVTTLAISACAPAVTATPSVVEPPPAAPTEAAALPPGAIPTQPPVASFTAVPSEIPSPTAVVLPVATSRGPELEATDPTTVVLASGGLQFVEFFRFT